MTRVNDARPIRIGFNARCLEEPQTRGLSRYTSCLLRALSRRSDVELVLFSMLAPHPGHLEGVRASVVTFAARETAWQDARLPRQLADHGIDLFHAPADRGLPVLKPCPTVVTVHGSYERAHWRRIFGPTKARAWYWKHELVNRLRADMVLTVSDACRRDLLARGIATAERLRAIPLAAAEEFTPGPSPADAAVLARAGVTLPYVLYVGGYDPHKNVDLLVQAFDRASLDGHQLVIVARQAGEYAALAQRWGALRAAARLRCLEADDADLPALFRGADLFVNASTWESFSLQTLEAMACGTPVLASNLPAIAEVAGGAAELFDPSDVAQLAERMTAVLGDRRRREALSVAGRRRATQFSWTQTADDTVRAYRDVLDRVQVPARAACHA